MMQTNQSFHLHSEQIRLQWSCLILIAWLVFRSETVDMLCLAHASDMIGQQRFRLCHKGTVTADGYTSTKTILPQCLISEASND